MATTVLPAVIDALVTKAKANLASVNVYDGFGVTADPGTDYVMVGVDDPDANDAGAAAEVQQGWANANYTARDEDGVIACAAVSWNGDSDAKAARDSAFATVNAFETFLRSDPTLGLANLLWAEFGSHMSLSQDQSQAGATALVIFRIHYRARI